MNKKSWVTVVLDGTVPLTKIKKLLDKSYTLA
jgi:predicted DNA-binding protein (MmcQ/YjbR family)